MIWRMYDSPGVTNDRAYRFPPRDWAVGGGGCLLGVSTMTEHSSGLGRGRAKHDHYVGDMYR